MKYLILFPKENSQWKWLIIRWSIIFLLFLSAMYYMTRMPGSSYSGLLKPLSQEERQIRDNLEQHVKMLSNTIGERNIYSYEHLKESRNYISTAFKKSGLKISYQTYVVGGKTVENIEGELSGTANPDEIVVIGAHYDSVPLCPGANDNASGVAALLETARILAGSKFAKTLRFVAFTNEEPPYFQTKNMGSRLYAARSCQRGEKITAMLSLETIGFYSDDKGSQTYPPPFSFYYPDTGNFIGFVSNLGSRNLMFDMINTFRKNAGLPSEGIAAPRWIPGIGWSDHWAFWKEGYKAVMLTDTAPFRYAFYHTPQDTWEKLDYERMARVVNGIVNVISDLSDKGERDY
jgi:Zn-dependent M28 family amino/carboxypeptidase